ncbi:MAG: 50S ribosomal protein L21 [Candidatus Omnitrophica bacterium]|nr:50S ribosomal protein L21 [Candidatus Omnitrophota bacterium]
MYAVVEVGGRQWKVEPGTRVTINRIAAAAGQEHVVDRVLLAHDGTHARIGRPYLEGAKVVCEVLDHRLGPKEISYHFRRRENWRKTRGHRQPLTRLVVKTIAFGGATIGQTAVTAKRPAPAASLGRAPRTSALKPQVRSLAKRPVTRPRTSKDATNA